MLLSCSRFHWIFSLVSSYNLRSTARLLWQKAQQEIQFRRLNLFLWLLQNVFYFFQLQIRRKVQRFGHPFRLVVLPQQRFRGHISQRFSGMFLSCNPSRNSSRTWKDGTSSSTPLPTFAWCVRMGCRSLYRGIRLTIGFSYYCRRRRHCFCCCCCCYVVVSVHFMILLFNTLSLRWFIGF